MSAKITYAELRILLENDDTPEETLAPFFIPGPSKHPMSPHLRFNEELVDIPIERGLLFDLTVNYFNRWSQRRRRLAFEKKNPAKFFGFAPYCRG